MQPTSSLAEPVQLTDLFQAAVNKLVLEFDFFDILCFSCLFNSKIP